MLLEFCLLEFEVFFLKFCFDIHIYLVDIYSECLIYKFMVWINFVVTAFGMNTSFNSSRDGAKCPISISRNYQLAQNLEFNLRLSLKVTHFTSSCTTYLKAKRRILSIFWIGPLVRTWEGSLITIADFKIFLLV